MRRRAFLGGLLAAGAGAPRADGAVWLAWKARFLAGGRVRDDLGGGISHSEGQGFGALLAQVHGDRAALAAIEAWTRAHLMVRRDALMGWRWHPDRGVAGTDWHNASDGDLMRAWALWRAAREGWSEHAGRAAPIARDLAALCLAPDPGAPDHPLLTPGAEARREAGRVLFNPSYVMGRALRDLAGAAPALARAADRSEAVIARLAAEGPLPDWIDITATGPLPPREHALRSGYDAVRVPLWLCWSGRRGNPAVARALDTWAAAPAPGHLAIVTRDGAVAAQSDRPGYRAIAALARGARVTAGPGDMAAQSYYPATLHLLALAAARESAELFPNAADIPRDGPPDLR